MSNSRAMRGDLARSSTIGATATLRFRGNGVGLVMPTGTSQGSIEVCLDPDGVDEDCRTIDLGSLPDGYRQVVAAFTDLSPGRHRLRVMVVSGTVRLDGAIISR